MSWHHGQPVAIKGWILDDAPDLDWFNRPRNPTDPDPDGIDQRVLRSLGEEVSQTLKAPEIHLEDGRIVVLESA